MARGRKVEPAAFFSASVHHRLQKGPAKCIYDWVKGKEGTVLGCTTHKGHTIVRVRALGHDVLLHLLEEGMVTGKALEDAIQVAQVEDDPLEGL